MDRRQGSAEAVKADGAKPMCDLLPPGPLVEVASVLTFGADKYASYNYLYGEGLRHGRLYAAALRHLFAYWKGEDLDEETGMSHIAHAMCCLLMLMHLQELGKGEDDRPSSWPRAESTQ